MAVKPVRVGKHDRSLQTGLTDYGVGGIRSRLAFHTLTGTTPEGGVLVARKYRGDAGLEESLGLRSETKMLPMDVLLGDDKFIFLSVDKVFMLKTGGLETCYVFDAEELVRNGAYVRLSDILETDAWMEFSRPVVGIMMTESFMDNFEDRFEDEPPGNPLELNREQLLWLFRRNPEVKLLFDRLKEKAKEITLKGDVALEALKSCGSESGCEILVPRKLPLARAIEAGSISTICEKYETTRA